jgi:hypothetical protein
MAKKNTKGQAESKPAVKKNAPIKKQSKTLKPDKKTVLKKSRAETQKVQMAFSPILLVLTTR